MLMTVLVSERVASALAVHAPRPAATTTFCDVVLVDVALSELPLITTAAKLVLVNVAPAEVPKTATPTLQTADS